MKKRPSKLDQAVSWLEKHESLIIYFVMAYAFLLLSIRIGDALGGFHGSNEGFYSNLAVEAMKHSPIELFTKPLDFNNPPLFTLLLVISFSIFGVAEAAARIVPIIASLFTIYYLYLLAKRLFNIRIAIIAAAITSVAPAYFLLSRNIQIDMVALLFIIAFLYHYIVSVDDDKWYHAIAAGAYFGLAMLSKLPAVLILFSIFTFETFRNRNLKWIFRIKTLGTAVAALLVTGVWYGYQYIFNTSYFMASQTGLVATRSMPNLYFWQELFYREFLWALSPPVFVLAIIAVGYLIWQRSPGAALALSTIAIYMLFYIFYHFHTYYILPAIPFLCLGVAVLLDYLIENKVALAATAASIVILMTFYSLLIMSGQKYGYTEFRDLKQESALINDSTTLYVDQIIRDNYEPIIKFYFPKQKILTFDPSAQLEYKNSIRVTYNRYGLPYNAQAYGIFPQSRRSIRPVLFGVAFYQKPDRLHQFANGALESLPVGSLYNFGLTSVEVPSMFLVEDLYKPAYQVNAR